MKKLLGLLAAIMLLAGCGGGGGAGAIGGATVNTFATDSVNDDFSHVWVKIHKIEIVGANRATLFEDTSGKEIDLKTLRDAIGAKYALMDSSSVTPGAYNQVLVTLDRDLSVVPTGTTTAQTKQFSDDHNSATAGMSELKLALTGFNASGKSDLVIDFDLANWNAQPDGKIKANLRRGDDTGLENENRHVEDDFGGRVQGIAGTSPNFTFTLVRGNGRNFTVKTDPTTKIFNQNGAPNPVLTNALHVEVSGAFVGGMLIARAIKIENEDRDDDPHKIKGLGTSSGGVISVKVRLAVGFTPDSTTYTVNTTASTRYLSDAGVSMTRDEFIAAMASSTEIEVEGTARSGGVFDAVKLKLENENENEAEIKGPISAITADGLTMSAQSWFGASLTQGQAITVKVTGSTQFRLGNSVVSKAQFFAGVSAGTIVEAKGALTGSTLTAVRLKDDD
ncbi:MAG: DUF5666 domain-containing protein [Fimbriimonadaceae bacterium]